MEFFILQANISITNESCPQDAQTSENAYLSAIIIGFVRLLSSLLLSQLLLNHRRRFMYIVSAILTIVSLFCFATCDLLIENDFMIQGLHVLSKYSSNCFNNFLIFSTKNTYMKNIPFSLYR